MLTDFIGLEPLGFETSRLENLDTKKRTVFHGSSRSFMAPRVGFEPTTLRLTAGCSAVELPRNFGALSSFVAQESIIDISIFRASPFF